MNSQNTPTYYALSPRSVLGNGTINSSNTYNHGHPQDEAIVPPHNPDTSVTLGKISKSESTQAPNIKVPLRRKIEAFVLSRRYELTWDPALRVLGLECFLMLGVIVAYVAMYPNSQTDGPPSAPRRDLATFFCLIYLVLVMYILFVRFHLPNLRTLGPNLLALRIISYTLVLQVVKSTGLINMVNILFNNRPDGRIFLTWPLQISIPYILFSIYVVKHLRVRFKPYVALLVFFNMAVFVALMLAPYLPSRLSALVVLPIASQIAVTIAIVWGMWVFYARGKSVEKRLTRVTFIFFVIVALIVVMIGDVLYFTASNANPQPATFENKGTILETSDFLVSVMWGFILPSVLLWGEARLSRYIDAVKNLNERERLKNQFLRWVFHQIRVPLNNTYLGLQDLHDQFEDVAELISTSTTEWQRCYGIIAHNSAILSAHLGITGLRTLYDVSRPTGQPAKSLFTTPMAGLEHSNIPPKLVTRSDRAAASYQRGQVTDEVLNTIQKQIIGVPACDLIAFRTNALRVWKEISLAYQLCSRSCGTISHVLDAVRDFSNVSSMTFKIQTHPFDLVALVRRVCANFRTS